VSASVILRAEGTLAPTTADKRGPPAIPLSLLVERAVHEMRTPLNAVLGWASMLRTQRLDEAARARAVEAIERSARAEARILEELVHASRALAGEVELSVAAVDLPAAVAAAVEAVRPDAEAGAVALSAALDAEGSLVAGDPDLLGKVLRELIANAVRATPRGDTVAVRLARAGTTAEIAVRDTGHGRAAGEDGGGRGGGAGALRVDLRGAAQAGHTLGARGAGVRVGHVEVRELAPGAGLGVAADQLVVQAEVAGGVPSLVDGLGVSPSLADGLGVSPSGSSDPVVSKTRSR
jgi:hypothetical protein